VHVHDGVGAADAARDPAVRHLQRRPQRAPVERVGHAALLEDARARLRHPRQRRDLLDGMGQIH
jgi:hypothetical protein